MASRPRALPAFWALICFLFAAYVQAQGTKTSLTVLAAASLSDVLPQVAEAWKKARPDVELRLSFDGSSRLAKEIEEGIPADLFFSADSDWMDELQEKNQISAETRLNLLGNEIVLIVPTAVQSPRSISDLASPRFKKIALAGENVPISKYSRSALEKAGVWAAVQSKIVRGDHVRTDLKWVEENEVDAGIVYRTDALNDPKVKIAFSFPKESYPSVVYPGAVIARSKSKEIALRFLEFCRSKEAQGIFKQNGFVPLEARSSK